MKEKDFKAPETITVDNDPTYAGIIDEEKNGGLRKSPWHKFTNSAAGRMTFGIATTMFLAGGMAACEQPPAAEKTVEEDTEDPESAQELEAEQDHRYFGCIDRTRLSDEELAVLDMSIEEYAESDVNTKALDRWIRFDSLIDTQRHGEADVWFDQVGDVVDPSNIDIATCSLDEIVTLRSQSTGCLYQITARERVRLDEDTTDMRINKEQFKRKTYSTIDMPQEIIQSGMETIDNWPPQDLPIAFQMSVVSSEDLGYDEARGVRTVAISVRAEVDGDTIETGATGDTQSTDTYELFTVDIQTHDGPKSMPMFRFVDRQQLPYTE